MIFRDNTATSGYCLCSDCRFGVLECYHKYTTIPNGIYVCSRLKMLAVKDVGICNLFEGRQEDATINR